VSHSSASAVRKLLTASGGEQTLIWCQIADLKKGIVDFGIYMDKHNPDVVIFDLSPPYDERRGVVVTTTIKARLDEVLGEHSRALEVVGRRTFNRLMPRSRRRRAGPKPSGI